MDKVEGHLEVGVNELFEVVINLDRDRTGHIVFSPNQARTLGALLLKKAGEASAGVVGPPFDGKPCPMCPIEIRNLSATAHNAVNRWDDWRQRGESLCKLESKMEDLRRAVAVVKPLSDAHFADPAHSHGVR